MMMAQGGGGSQPYASAVLLRQTNTVKTVPTDAQVIDPDIQVLLVAEARATLLQGLHLPSLLALAA